MLVILIVLTVFFVLSVGFAYWVLWKLRFFGSAGLLLPLSWFYKTGSVVHVLGVGKIGSVVFILFTDWTGLIRIALPRNCQIGENEELPTLPKGLYVYFPAVQTEDLETGEISVVERFVPAGFQKPISAIHRVARRSPVIHPSNFKRRAKRR